MRLNSFHYAHALYAAYEVCPDAKMRGLLLKRFMAILARRHHTRLLPAILRALGQMSSPKVRVTSARALPADLQRRIEETIGDSGTIETRIEPVLYGGAVIEFGDTRIDASLRGRVAALRQQFSQV